MGREGGCLAEDGAVVVPNGEDFVGERGRGSTGVVALGNCGVRIRGWILFFGRWSVFV